MGLISIYLCERFGLTDLALYGEGAVFVDGCFSQSAPYYVFNKVSLQIADTVECLQANVTCLKVKKEKKRIGNSIRVLGFISSCIANNLS